MICKLIASRTTLLSDLPRVDLIKTIREYYPRPHLIKKIKYIGNKTGFCVWLDDSPRIPNAKDPTSATGIIFTVNLEDTSLHLGHLNVNISKRGQGFSTNLLAPFWAIYKDFGFHYISLHSINNSFWKHIKEDFSWINFRISSKS